MQELSGERLEAQSFLEAVQVLLMLLLAAVVVVGFMMALLVLLLLLLVAVMPVVSTAFRPRHAWLQELSGELLEAAHAKPFTPDAAAGVGSA